MEPVPADQAPARHLASELVVVACALFVGCLLAQQTWGSFDEYTLLSDAVRVAAGQVMYRDFFEFTPPGVIWLAAALVALVGPKAAVIRAVQYALLVCASWWMQRLARHLGADPWTAALAGLGLFGVCVALNIAYSHHWLALTCVLASAHAALTAPAAGWGRWARAGAWAGLTMAFVQVEGLIALSGMLGFIGMRAWLAGEAWRPAVRRAACAVAGWAVPVALMLAVLAWQGALAGYVHDSWYWPPTHYRQPGGINDLRWLTDIRDYIGPMQPVRFGQLRWYAEVFHYLFVALVPPGTALVAFAWGLGLIARRLRTGPGATAQELATGYVGLLAIASMVVAFKGRVDLSHVAAYAAPALLLLAAAASRLRQAAPLPWTYAATLPTLLLALAIGAGFGSSSLNLPTRWGPDAGEQWVRSDPTVAWLRAHARPGDTMIAVHGGGYYAFNSLPLGARLSTIFQAKDRYYDEDQIAGFWADVASGRARFLVADPGPWGSDWTGPPAGYRLQARFVSLRFGGTVEIYERVAAAGASGPSAGSGAR